MAVPVLTGTPSQATFDAILRSLAEPGSIRQLPPSPSPDVPAYAMVALALGDIDLGVCVDDDPMHPLALMLRAATGMTITGRDTAQFVVCSNESVPVGDLLTGTALAPEDATRLTIAVDDLNTDGDDAVVLRGPGVPGARRLCVRGIDRKTLLSLGRASGTFPTGIDTWLITADGRVAAIPRSTTVTQGDH